MRGLLRSSLSRAGTCIFAGGLLISSACTTATGDVTGGEPRPFDAAAPANLAVPITEPTFSDASPTSWKGIYRDFFGRRSTSTCAVSGTCHGEANAAGTKLSNFLCPDVETCFKSLTTAKDPDPKVSTRALVEKVDVASPESAYLFKVISYRTADGTLVPNRKMPQIPVDFAFAPDDITRMQAWIKAGAKDD